MNFNYTRNHEWNIPATKKKQQISTLSSCITLQVQNNNNNYLGSANIFLDLQNQLRPGKP